MAKMKQTIRTVLVIACLFLLFGCQSAKTETETPKKPEEAIITAAKAYVKGFVQGDKTQYDAYYGTGAFDQEIEKQLTLANVSTSGETSVSVDLWKQMMIQSKKMYAKAEVVSIEKKDETTALVKIKAIAIKAEDRETWVMKKQDELYPAVQRGDEKAIQRMNGLIGEVFEAIATGGIPSTIEAEEVYEMRFTDKAGKLYPVDDLNTISSFFLKNK